MQGLKLEKIRFFFPTFVCEQKRNLVVQKTRIAIVQGLRIFPASREYFSRFPDFFRFDLVFFVFRIFFVSGGIFPASAGIFLASAKKKILASEGILFRFEKEYFFPCRKVFFMFPALFPLPQNICPIAKNKPAKKNRFGAECDKRTAGKNIPATMKYFSRFGAKRKAGSRQ